MTDTVTTSASDDPTLSRLEDQIGWYSRKSQSAQRKFKRIKVAVILAAAVIPLLTGLKFPHVALVIGGLGVLITILEGILHLNQYQQIWTVYRSTCEALTHEKFLFLPLAGPYANAANPRALLAERIEAVMSQENGQWVSLQQQNGKSQGSGS
ncbi:MAG TPA: DUF4231 domain-containing protein [Silvibacterium sp.]|nr:DUF4231 domain-containing protein [Silvibacterium sp.]